MFRSEGLNKGRESHQGVVINTGDGSYVVEYYTTISGRYDVNVAIDGRHIISSPFSVWVQSADVSPEVSSAFAFEVSKTSFSTSDAGVF